MARMAYSLATAYAHAELWPQQAITAPPCPGCSALRLASRPATPPGIEILLGRPPYKRAAPRAKRCPDAFSALGADFLDRRRSGWRSAKSRWRTPPRPQGVLGLSRPGARKPIDRPAGRGKCSVCAQEAR